ncbi:MAG: heme exporter protein CcmD [Burkholderiales bacterium]|nr:heme exporter protein CcmD [Burkholderiales bacterium]MDQ3195468.1 heme exporter protein CcmD [Pseudomonadota bacterium]
MNWNSASEFFAMGGYGLYVWGSYLITTAAIAIELLALRGRRRTIRLRLSRMRESQMSAHVKVRP